LQKNKETICKVLKRKVCRLFSLLLPGIDFVAQNTGWFESHNSSGIEHQVITGLGITPTTGTLLADIKFTKSAQEKI
jgi:hypothetical protein